MKLVEILKLANANYPDGWLAYYFDPETGKLVSGYHGDALAEFIVTELQDTFEPVDSQRHTEADQLKRAISTLRRGVLDLNSVINALQDKLAEIQ